MERRVPPSVTSPLHSSPVAPCARQSLTACRAILFQVTDQRGVLFPQTALDPVQHRGGGDRLPASNTPHDLCFMDRNPPAVPALKIHSSSDPNRVPRALWTCQEALLTGHAAHRIKGPSLTKGFFLEAKGPCRANLRAAGATSADIRVYINLTEGGEGIRQG